MREIKFKFVIENNGKKYISGEYTLDENGLPDEVTILEDMEECNCSLNESVSVCEGDCIEFFEGEVVDKIQFIGIKDKNGKEIYGQDICKMVILEGEEALNPPEALRVIIEWKNAAWGFRHLFPELVHEDDRDWCAFNKEDGEMWDADYFEVIGNFHDSPELSKR